MRMCLNHNGYSGESVACPTCNPGRPSDEVVRDIADLYEKDGSARIAGHLRACADAWRGEQCICAAIRIGDLIVRGHRHDSCFHTASLIPGVQRSAIRKADQGFVTSRNRFVGREEAMQLQKASGVKSAYSPDGEYRGDILFSEDLY